jgi:hypothetical protein
MTRGAAAAALLPPRVLQVTLRSRASVTRQRLQRGRDLQHFPLALTTLPAANVFAIAYEASESGYLRRNGSMRFITSK